MRDSLKGNQLEPQRVFLGGGDRYKIDYSAVAVKSRCAAEVANKALNINILCWSGRRDSNPRPSAPKADALPGCATPRRSVPIVSRMVFTLRSRINMQAVDPLNVGQAEDQPHRQSLLHCEDQNQGCVQRRQKFPIQPLVVVRLSQVAAQQTAIALAGLPHRAEYVAEKGSRIRQHTNAGNLLGRVRVFPSWV
jgi:hypothetical protein